MMGVPVPAEVGVDVGTPLVGVAVGVGVCTGVSVGVATGVSPGVPVATGPGVTNRIISPVSAPSTPRTGDGIRTIRIPAQIPIQ